MDGRSSFRVVGEQIDGSSDMSGDDFPDIEAEMASRKPVGASDVRSFNAKVEDTAWMGSWDSCK